MDYGKGDGRGEFLKGDGERPFPMYNRSNWRYQMSLTTYEQIMQMTRQLELAEQLRLLEALTRLVRHQAAATSHSIMELEGLGAEIWQDVDAQTYVNEERASWES